MLYVYTYLKGLVAILLRSMPAINEKWLFLTEVENGNHDCLRGFGCHCVTSKNFDFFEDVSFNF